MKKASEATSLKPVVPYWVLVVLWLGASGVILWYAIRQWTSSDWIVMSIVAALAIGLYFGEKGAPRR